MLVMGTDPGIRIRTQNITDPEHWYLLNLSSVKLEDKYFTYHDAQILCLINLYLNNVKTYIVSVCISSYFSMLALKNVAFAFSCFLR
jgi:hypothetical protein